MEKPIPERKKNVYRLSSICVSGNEYGRIYNSFRTGSINAESGGFLGGLVGYASGTISNSFATGRVPHFEQRS
ncbi:MAG: hypothetical protein H7240_03195 [Glaciimonas sp.]|nr:hypothetical protein [Glaciimonas sp.]